MVLCRIHASVFPEQIKELLKVILWRGKMWEKFTACCISSSKGELKLLLDIEEDQRKPFQVLCGWTQVYELDMYAHR